MKHSGKQQRGQALILIVFAIVGMVGLTALAIDGGNVYSDRRHAQNAADTAALAAGLRMIRGYSDWQVVAQNLAQDNGYAPSGAHSTVDVYLCSGVPAGKPACVLAPGEQHPETYVQVVITSVVNTYFAPIVGIRHITNEVEAIAHAVPPVEQSWYNGNALVSLMPGCKESGWNADPFTISGSQISVVNGSGIYVNSNCPNAFVQNGNNSLSSAGDICVVGGVAGTLNNVSPAPTTGCQAKLDPSTYKLPPLDSHSCDSEGNGHIDNLGGGNLYAHPGKYSGSFPPGSSGNLQIGQGIYCLQGGISVQGGWDMTTDLNNNHLPDANEGALFFVQNGDVSISGNSSIYLSAINNTASGLSADLVNYLIYLPPSNTNSVKITGGSSNTYIGTILAPASLVSLNGGSGTDSLNMQTQIIGYSLVLTGSSNLTITYNQNQNAKTYSNPQLTPYK